MKKQLKISYIGGGSMFVCTMAHAIMEIREELQKEGVSIDVSLMDINLNNADAMRRYMDLVREKTGTPIIASVTSSMEEAITGSDLVVLSVPEKKKEQDEFWDLIGQPVDLESSYAVALTAVTNLDLMDQIAELMKRTAPDAMFAALMNPTDTLAAYMQKKHGITSIGMCVEVQNLITTLAYLLGVKESEIELSHIGVNHFGWVTSLKVCGKDGYALLREQMEAWKQRPDWPRYWNWFADLFLATGYLRTSDAHRWPVGFDWVEGTGLGKDEIPMPISDLYQPYIREALEKGELVGKLPKTSIYGHVQYEALMYPSLKGTFAQLIRGLLGHTTAPLPLQVQNGKANTGVSPEAWLEIPCRFTEGKLAPQTAEQAPEWVTAQLEDIIQQRVWIADWLVDSDPEGLRKALFNWQDTVEIGHALAFWRRMEEYMAARK